MIACSAAASILSNITNNSNIKNAEHRLTAVTV